MKSLLILFLLFYYSIAISQEHKILSLTTSGQGKTIEEAKYSALKEAFERAGQKIISSTKSAGTEQEVSKLVTVKNCVIEGYDILSEEQLSDGSFKSTLKVTVSTNELLYIVSDLSICNNNVIVFKNNQDAINYAKYLTN